LSGGKLKALQNKTKKNYIDFRLWCNYATTSTNNYLLRYFFPFWPFPMRRYETALENIQNKQNKNLRKNNPYSSFNNTLCIPQKKIVQT